MRHYFFPIVLILGGMSACKTTSADSKPTSSPTDSASTSPQQKSPLDQGRELTTLFYKGEVAPIWARMTDQMHGALGSEQSLASFQQQVEAQLGTETKLIDEHVTASPPYQVYLRTAEFSKFGKPVVVQWALDEAGNIAGFFVKPQQ